jgi:hypothetical protein
MNITIIDFKIGLNVLHGIFAMNHKLKTTTNKNICPNKPVGKNVVTIKNKNPITFTEGFNLWMKDCLCKY